MEYYAFLSSSCASRSLSSRAAHIPIGGCAITRTYRDRIDQKWRDWFCSGFDLFGPAKQASSDWTHTIVSPYELCWFWAFLCVLIFSHPARWTNQRTTFSIIIIIVRLIFKLIYLSMVERPKFTEAHAAHTHTSSTSDWAKPGILCRNDRL